MKRVNQQQQIKFFGNYRQNIPWFAVYSFGGSRSGRGIRAENTNKIITKKNVEERVEDLVKKVNHLTLLKRIIIQKLVK
jgi:hypothetical protein